MKSLTARLIASLATIGLGAIPAACGEKPSFVQQEQTVNRRTNTDGVTNAPSADATNPNGPKGVIGQGHPGEADVSGMSDGGVEGSSTTNGGNGKPGDETIGDKEGSSEGSHPGGHDDGGNGMDGTGAGGDGAGTGGHDSPDNDGSDTMHTTGGATGAADGDVVLPPRKTVKREVSFPADAEMTAEVTKSLDDAFLTQTIALKRNDYDHAKTVKQVTRPVATDTFAQGTAGDTVNEAFDQVAGRILDILVVVDDSASMAEEQANLSNKLLPLLSSIQDADWQIGVTTTDPSEPCLRALIKKSDANPAQAFKAAVTAGITSSGNERPFLTAVKSLRGDCLAQPWIRKDSNLAVLIVSDEDNCSYKGEDCPNKDYAKASYLVDYLASIRQVGKTARVHGIIWHPSQTRAQCPTGYVDDNNRDHKGYLTADVIAQTSGAWGSICDADYTATLSNVSKNILVTLNSKFMLQQAPDLGTLHVFIAGVEVTAGFTVTGRLLEFGAAPAEGAKVTVTYHHGSTPVTKTFALRFKALADRLAVTVNGQLAQPADYAVITSGNTSSVDFYAYPADKATIAVTYVRDVPLNTQFQLGEAVRAGTLKVRVDGVEVRDFTVLEASGVVTFPSAPAEGATIGFAYTAVGDAVLAYPFTVDGAAPVDLTLTDADTGAPVRFAYLTGAVVIDPTEFVEGRRVTFKYDNVARQRFSIVLPNAPVPATVVAHGGQKACVAPAVMVSGTTVSVDGCGFADDVMSVSVRYQFVTAHYQEFTFAADNLPGPTAFQEWTVLVNDRPAMGYTRVGNVVTFAEPLARGAVVKIQLIQDDK